MARIGDQQLLHGAALVELVCGAGGPVVIRYAADIHENLYVLEAMGRRRAVLVKTATTRRIWQFTFTVDELAAIRKSEAAPDSCFIALVCGRDGVCCVPLNELDDLLPLASSELRYVRVSRPPGGSYRVKGPGRVELRRTIRASDWPRRALGD